MIGITGTVLAACIGVQSGASATSQPRLGGGVDVESMIQQGITSAAPRAVGTAFHGLWTMYDDVQRTWVLDQLQWAGVTSVRMDLSWIMLQPDGPDTYYKWGVDFVDHVISMINAHGMKPLMTLWQTPPWANGYRGQHALPDNPGGRPGRPVHCL